MILRKHPAWPKKKIRVLPLVLYSIHRQSLICRFRQGRAASHPQSCSAVPATPPMDSSKENAQSDGARKAVSHTNLSAPPGINRLQHLLSGFLLAGATASAPLVHAGASREISPQRGRRRHSLRLLPLSDLNRRPRSRWKRRATTMTLGSPATTMSRTKG